MSNNTTFHASIILLSFSVSFVTLSLFGVYFIVYFIAYKDGYNQLCKESLSILPQLFEFTITIFGISLLFPFVCSVLVGRLEGAAKNVKSLSYMW